MKALIRVCFVVLVLVSGYGYAYGAEGWEATLKVSVPRAYNRLSFGQKADATDGIDGAYDAPAMLNGDMKAYFKRDDGNYWRDIKAFGGSKRWTVRVESPLKGSTVSVSWKPETLVSLKAATLTDVATGMLVDMKSAGDYSYTNGGTKDFTIDITP